MLKLHRNEKPCCTPTNHVPFSMQSALVKIPLDARARPCASFPVQPRWSEPMSITESEVNAAQRAWCDRLVRIGAVYKASGDFRATATTRIDELYGHRHGAVVFKPTLAQGQQTFRNTARGALSYFVGGDPQFPDDRGFALKPWARVWYDNNAAENGIQIHGIIAITMGNVYLADYEGNEIIVDKTFVF